MIFTLSTFAYTSCRFLFLCQDRKPAIMICVQWQPCRTGINLVRLAKMQTEPEVLPACPPPFPRFFLFLSLTHISFSLVTHCCSETRNYFSSFRNQSTHITFRYHKISNLICAMAGFFCFQGVGETDPKLSKSATVFIISQTL